MASRWPQARLVEDPVFTKTYMDRIFAEPGQRPHDEGIRLLLKGTEFQVKVWEALMRIQPGDYTTYGSLADDPIERNQPLHADVRDEIE